MKARTPSPRQKRCLESLRKHAKENTFLGTADQSPRLEQLLTELNSLLQRDESDAGDRLSNIVRGIDKRGKTLVGMLQELRASLEQALGLLQQDMGQPVLNAAVTTLSTGGETLARHLRHRLLNFLEDAAPTHDLIPNLLNAVIAGRQTAVQTLPESLWLLRTRHPDITPCVGQALAELAIEPVLESLCNSPWRAR